MLVSVPAPVASLLSVNVTGYDQQGQSAAVAAAAAAPRGPRRLVA